MKHYETQFDYKRACIIDKTHPYYASCAVCMGVDLTDIGFGMKFKCLKTNEEFYVFNGKSVEWIDK